MKTLKLRIKDKHATQLNILAGTVNFVWNYVNELITTLMIKQDSKTWISQKNGQKPLVETAMMMLVNLFYQHFELISSSS